MTSNEKFCISGLLLARGTLSFSLSEHESSEAYITCPNPACCDGNGVLLDFIHGPHETQFYIGKWRVSWSQSTDLSSILMLQMSKMPAVRGMVHVHSHPTPQAQGERSQRSEGNRVLSCCRLQKIARQRSLFQEPGATARCMMLTASFGTYFVTMCATPSPEDGREKKFAQTTGGQEGMNHTTKQGKTI